MADEKTTPAAEEKSPAAGPPKRKYTYLGKAIVNPIVYNRYGTLKIRPWAMTDAEIDECIRKRPDLARLWKAS